MSRFAGAQHVMAGHGSLNMSQPVLKGSAKVVSRSNRICPQVFLVSSLQASGPIDQIVDMKGKESTSESLFVVAENLLKATFDDSMPEEAYAKKHSMTREASETGVSARVYRTILTHFSQRYPKIHDSYTSPTFIAFDMMSVNLADLALLPSL